MTELVWALVGFCAGVVPSVAVLVRYQDLVLRSFRESEREHREERTRLTERLSVRTAATPVEAGIQALVARPRTPRPHPDEDPDEFRREAARRGVQPMGL